MTLKTDLILIFLFVIGSIVSYFLAKKYQNKKLLIPTYMFMLLIFLALTYLTLDIIIVGGI